MINTFKSLFHHSKEWSISNDVIEKKFVMDFLQRLPMDRLKILVNLKCLDFENAVLWKDVDSVEKLQRLKESNSVEYSCQITFPVADTPVNFGVWLIDNIQHHSKDGWVVIKNRWMTISEAFELFNKQQLEHP